MKAVVYKEPKEVATETVDHPKIERPTDALIKITTTNICGPDLHSYGGRVGLEEGRIVGHENQGEVIEVGDAAKDSNTPPPLPVSAPLLGYTQSQVLLTLPLPSWVVDELLKEGQWKGSLSLAPWRGKRTQKSTQAEKSDSRD